MNQLRCPLELTFKLCKRRTYSEPVEIMPNVFHNQTLKRIIAKIGIPSDKYQKDWKSRLRRGKKV